MPEPTGCISLQELYCSPRAVAEQATRGDLVLTNQLGKLVGIVTRGDGYMPFRSTASRLMTRGFSPNGLGERPLFVFSDQLHDRWHELSAKLKSKNGVIIGIESDDTARCNLAIIPLVDRVESILLTAFLRENPVNTDTLSLTTDELVTVLIEHPNTPA